MLVLISLVICVVSTVYAVGEFSVLHHPPSLSFKGHDHLRESTLKEVYSAALGFSTEQYSKWEGMYLNDPFGLAEAVVAVVVDGVSDIGLVKGHHFPLRTDEDEDSIYSTVERRISDRYPEQNANLVRVDFSDGLSDIQKYTIFNSIKSDKPKKNMHSFLKNDVDEDREFLREIRLLNAIIEKIEKGAIKKDFIPDIYWFKLNSLHPLQDLYGENSTTVKEAKQLLNEAIINLNKAFNEAYQGSVLVTVITSDVSHTRKSRSILQASPTSEDIKQNPHNLAKNYSRNYAVIFNIILWFGVIMVFTLLAISMVIGNMDPGRDSIIYRMTSTRMKKDN